MKTHESGSALVLRFVRTRGGKGADLDGLGLYDAAFPAQGTAGTQLGIDARFLQGPDHGPRNRATRGTDTAFGT